MRASEGHHSSIKTVGVAETSNYEMTNQATQKQIDLEAYMDTSTMTVPTTYPLPPLVYIPHPLDPQTSRVSVCAIGPDFRYACAHVKKTESDRSVTTPYHPASRSMSLERTYLIFRSMALRHLPVVNKGNIPVGMITRKVRCTLILHSIAQ